MKKEYEGAEVKKAICFWCKPRCHQEVYVKDGRLLGLSKSPIKGCPRWSKAKEIFYNPTRTTFPMKRAGERGENRWQQISWDQAFDEIAEKLTHIRDTYGAEAVVGEHGTSRTYEEFRYRFLNLFGSPNNFGQGHICHGNSAVVACMTLGWWPYWMNVEKLDKARCVMMIGRNPGPSHQTVRDGLKKAQKRGAHLIVADPRPAEITKDADMWLRIRPGTDAALLLGMMNVIVEEGLYDKPFIEKWTHGFEDFAERLKEYPPAKVSKITKVSAEDVIKAARLYATETPSCIMEGMGMAHQPNCLQSLLCRYLMPALLGLIDVEGGEELMGPAPFITEHEIEMPDALAKEQAVKMIGKQFKLFSSEGYELIQQNVERVWGKRCDFQGAMKLSSAPLVFRAMAYGDPYPVKALIGLACNPMVTMPNTRLVYKGLKNLDLYVVLDKVWTPSTQLADYVLPAAEWLERDFLWNYHNTTPLLEAGEQALPKTMPGEYDRRDDYEIFRGLAIRLGQAEHWPWESLRDYYDHRLKPMGLTFEELLQMGHWFPEKRAFKKYEKTGFGTPTGKVEFRSTVLEQLGYDPLPKYLEPQESPVSAPETAKKYPYTLITGGRFLPYFHSEFRNVKSFRKSYPHPKVEIHPDTAKTHGVKEGDWVWIETERGRIIQKCKYLDGLDPDVLHAQHGWWYPELPGEEPWLHGVWVSNVNVLTEKNPDHLDEALGSWPLRTMLCKIYKAETSDIPIPL
ncbi:MAG: molybdopterin-dependent oxidoreductase [Desulfobacteraceae bacterium]